MLNRLSQWFQRAREAAGWIDPDVAWIRARRRYQEWIQMPRAERLRMNLG